MSTWFWESVVRDGMRVPAGLGLGLGELTDELGDMLGSPDPDLREELAHRILGSWISDGIYDRLLRRLGSGLCGLLEEGLGTVNDDSVFLRSSAARVLAEVIERDNRMGLLDDRTVLGWGDRVANWWRAEKDLRGFVPGKGWAYAVAYGADVVGVLAASPRLRGSGLVFLVDVVADRVLEPTPEFFVAGESDRLALAVMRVLRRDLVDIEALEPWLSRLGERAAPEPDDMLHPFRVNGNVQAFLRSLYLQLALAPERPGLRSDLLLALVERLRVSNPAYLRPLGARRADLAAT